MNLGENIYQLRKAKHMSQDELAEALEVSRQSVSKWETGSATPELDKLMKMARLFEISLDQLVGNLPSAAPIPASGEPKQKLPLRQILGIILFIFTLILGILSFFTPSIPIPIWIALVCACGLLAASLLFYHSTIACLTGIGCTGVSFYLWLHGAVSPFFLYFLLLSAPISLVWASLRLRQNWK